MYFVDNDAYKQEVRQEDLVALTDQYYSPLVTLHAMDEERYLSQVGYVYELHVHLSLQGKGIGGALLQEAEDAMQQPVVMLTVAQAGPVSFYENGGRT